MQTESLKKASIGLRLAREQVARAGWTGMRASFAVDAAKARREARAEIEASGSDYNPELEAASGCVMGAPVRALIWSARLGRHVWWAYANACWNAQGVDRATARKLRVELSDANAGESVEEVLADRLEAEAE